jgi:site-specific DNA-methyltransferase (adenine-specific)
MMPTEYLLPAQPDILEVISNLSNDEVFTPPKIANAVLDLLPTKVWSDPTLRWLDPGCKTGVFPREITKRLMIGLENAIPNKEDRLKHILSNMVFAIAITELTGMVSRRTLYCSRDPSSVFSAVKLSSASGNIWYDRVEHNFDSRGRCIECGGTNSNLEYMGSDNYAYGLIHSDGRKKIAREIGMDFDVIVGNPPYQMDAESGNLTLPIYNIFFNEAKKLNPRYIAFIIPSRWMAGGQGLREFRVDMLSDKRIRTLVDRPIASEVFPSVDIKGGVCYFMWDRDNPGPCSVTLVRGDEVYGPKNRDLSEFDVFVRDDRALGILHKVLIRPEPSLASLVSGNNPFGISTNFRNYRDADKQNGDIKLHLLDGQKRTSKWVDPAYITRNMQLMKAWKVLIPAAGSDGGQSIPDVVLGRPFVSGPRTVCSQTYLVIGPLESKDEANNLERYIKTRFVRFLISLRKISQHAGRNTYTWVPQQTWDHPWTDAELYEKYGITSDEQAYIETMIKEMEI